MTTQPENPDTVVTEGKFQSTKLGITVTAIDKYPRDLQIILLVPIGNLYTEQVSKWLKLQLILCSIGRQQLRFLHTL